MLYLKFESDISTEIENGTLTLRKQQNLKNLIFEIMTKDLESLDQKYKFRVSDAVRNARRVYSLVQLCGWKCIHMSTEVKFSVIRDYSVEVWDGYIKDIKNHLIDQQD